MKTKHTFTPGQVVPMEERALLSGFHFPAVVGPVSTLGLRGAFVLTSRTYQNLQATVNTAILNFEKSVIRAYNRDGGFTDAFNTAVGAGTYGTGVNGWSYAGGSLLARLDSVMGAAEFKLPYGGGMGATNPTGGAGLSDKTALTTLNPVTGNLGGESVANLMDVAVNSASSAQTLSSGMETVRSETLAFNVTAADSPTTIGILPGYVQAFGPAGGRIFGLKNT